MISLLSSLQHQQGDARLLNTYLTRLFTNTSHLRHRHIYSQFLGSLVWHRVKYNGKAEKRHSRHGNGNVLMRWWLPSTPQGHQQEPRVLHWHEKFQQWPHHSFTHNPQGAKGHQSPRLSALLGTGLVRSFQMFTAKVLDILKIIMGVHNSFMNTECLKLL